MEQEQINHSNHFSSEKTMQSLSQELSLKQIFQILLQNWPLFLILLVLFVSISSGYYFLKVPFVAKASVIVSDSQNSSLQSFAQQLIGGGSAKLNEAKKSNSSLQKHLEYFRTTDFFTQFIDEIQNNLIKKNLTVSEKIGQKYFINEILKNKKLIDLNLDEQIFVFKTLESSLNFKIISDYQLDIFTTSKEKELALFLTNTALEFILVQIKQRESEELKKVQNFLKEQKNSIDLELQSLNKKMSDFTSKPENLISLSSVGKVGDYISELMVRKNEMRLKISENNKIISSLSLKTNSRRENALYGNTGRIQSLQLENEVLHSKMNDFQKSIDRVSNQVKNLPAMNQSFEDLKKKSEIEFSKFKAVSDAIIKSEGYALALENKFEVLEKSRIEKIKPSIGLMTLILISIILTQFVGSLIIYLKTIWNSNIVTAQSTRNVVVVDSHSLDPRVIIENSKIRFRLKDSEFKTSREGVNFSSIEESNFKNSLGFNLLEPKNPGN